MNFYGNSVTRLVEEFSKLPGIGRRSAGRLAFYVLGLPVEKAKALSDAIINARTNIKFCSVCFNLTESDPCSVCDNPRRDRSVIMVVEDPRDMAAYEKTGEFKGVYHILHGAISPMNGIGPQDIKIKELLLRIQASDNEIREVIAATNPSVEGEATAMYISKLLKPLGILVTRIAHGIPVGGDLEHVDDVTLGRALEGRREI